MDDDFPFACPAGVVGGATPEEQFGPGCARPWYARLTNPSRICYTLPPTRTQRALLTLHSPFCSPPGSVCKTATVEPADCPLGSYVSGGTNQNPRARGFASLSNPLFLLTESVSTLWRSARSALRFLFRALLAPITVREASRQRRDASCVSSDVPARLARPCRKTAWLEDMALRRVRPAANVLGLVCAAITALRAVRATHLAFAVRPMRPEFARALLVEFARALRPVLYWLQLLADSTPTLAAPETIPASLYARGRTHQRLGQRHSSIAPRVRSRSPRLLVALQ